MNAMDMFRPVPALNLQRPSALGKVFYVDSDGTHKSDSNEGTDPDHPLITLQAGINKATDNNGDYVMVLDCYNSDTPPILFNSATTHVIGLATPASWGWTALAESSDLITLSGNYMEFAGFSLCPAAADAIHVSDNAGGYCWLHNLNFGVASGTLVNGIEFDGTSAFTNSLVEDCSFGLTQSTISGDAITGNGIQYTVRNCTFKQVATYCIEVVGTQGGGGNIYNNRFYANIGSSEAHGWAIYLNGTGCEGWMVCHNWAAQAADASGNNPYKDTSTGNASTCKNGWADNYDGSALTAGPQVT